MVLFFGIIFLLHEVMSNKRVIYSFVGGYYMYIKLSNNFHRML